jgi:hypothetical protein
MEYGSGLSAPEGVTEIIAGFYNRILVFVFVSISIVWAAVLVLALKTLLEADSYQGQSLGGVVVLLVLGYFVFVMSCGLLATFLSMRNHLKYQSEVLGSIARKLPRAESAPKDPLF